MREPYVPEFCVFEITLKCDARCMHCGSAAGQKRDNELSTKQAIGVVRNLKHLGCKVLTVSGGEPLCRPDWHLIAGEAVNLGMQTELITNGINTFAQIDKVIDAGFYAVGFSIDGPWPVHDHLRGVPGGLDKLLKAATALKGSGIKLSAITQINRLNIPHLEDILKIVEDTGFDGWQVQLTTPVGRAQKNSDILCIGPEHLEPLENKLLELRNKTNLFFQAADNIGYMGKGENRLRSGSKEKSALFLGCSAGIKNIGITSDGTVRGCLSMAPYFDEGNLQKRSLKKIWNDPTGFLYNRDFSPKKMLGHCNQCRLAKFCKGGCKSQAYAYSGNPLDNPMCVRCQY